MPQLEHDPIEIIRIRESIELVGGSRRKRAGLFKNAANALTTGYWGKINEDLDEKESGLAILAEKASGFGADRIRETLIPYLSMIEHVFFFDTGLEAMNSFRRSGDENTLFVGAVFLDSGIGFGNTIAPLEVSRTSIDKAGQGVASLVDELIEDSGKTDLIAAVMEDWAEYKMLLLKDKTGVTLIDYGVQRVRLGNASVARNSIQDAVMLGAMLAQETYKKLYPVAEHMISNPPRKNGLRAFFDKFRF